MPESTPPKLEKESKSQRKRDMHELQKMGESLTTLTAAQLATMNLPENLLEALRVVKSITAHGARRRQFQYIGKIMRDIDLDEIKQGLERIQLLHDANTAQFQQLETWRTKLLVEGDAALTEFLKEYPHAESQPLRQLIRKAQQDRKNEKNTGAEKALFRYLRKITSEQGS